MTSKTSLIKSGILRFQLKRFWWISGFYALLLFFATPFRILCRDKKDLLEQVARFPDTQSGILLNDAGMFVLLVAAAVLLGLCMFRYMQNVRSATLLHALPVKRRELYLSSLLSGFILLALPILVNAVILFGMSLWGGYAPVLPYYFILDWIGGQLLTGTATLCFAFFVGVLTGSSVAQLVFTFVFCFLPVGLTALFSFILDDWLFGFTDYFAGHIAEKLLQITPMYYPQFLCREPIWWIPVLMGVYILLFSGLGLFLYHKRDTERAGDVAAFNWMRPLFLYGVSFCTAVVGVAFVRSVSGESGGPSVIFVLLFALLGYGVAKALLLKSFRIWPYYKGYIVLAVMLLLLYSAVDMNLFGYGTKPPAEDSIKQAYVGYHYRHNWEKEWNSDGGTQAARFSDEASIRAICRLQQEAINQGQYTAKEAREKGLRQVYYAYITDSGRNITRVYYMKSDVLFDLFSTDAAKDSMYENIRKHPEKIKYVEYVHNTNQEIYGKQKDELVACVREDLNRLTFEEINAHTYLLEEAAGYTGPEEVHAEVQKTEAFRKSLVFTIESGDGDRNIWFDFNENFTETIHWLKQNGYMPVADE